MAYGDTYRQVAEPDWRGLRQMGQEDAMQEQVHQAARMKNFQDRGMLPDPNAEKIKLMQAKAQFDASNFEKRYTAKQKADLSQISAASTAIDNDPSFSDSEKMAAKKALAFKKMGISPADLPRLSPYPQGQGVGDVWDVPEVGKVTRHPDGHTAIFQGWKDSAQAQSAKDTHALEKAQLQERGKLATHLIDAKDAEGNPIKRHMTVDEMDDAMDVINGRRPGEKNVEGRARVAEQRKSAGLPDQPDASASVQGQPQQKSFTRPQQVDPHVSQAANSIIQEAIAHPEKMKDETFAQKARAARKMLGQ